jgi:hypothetical protein
MKKIINSLVLCGVLVASYSIIGLEDETPALMNSSENLFEGKNSLDPIDSERSSDLHDPEVMDDQDMFKDEAMDDKDDEVMNDKDQQLEGDILDDTNKNFDNENVVRIDTSIDHENSGEAENFLQEHHVSAISHPLVKSKDADVAESPKLTTKDLHETIEKHEKTAERYKELAGNIQKVWAALQGSELGKELNVVELTQLLHNVEHAYKNAGSIFELMLAFQKLGFDLGDKLESELYLKAKDLSAKAQELTEKAAEEMEKSLGIKYQH